MITDKEFGIYSDYIKDNVDLILVHGQAHSGKGAVSEILKTKYGFKEIGFADYLKEIAINYFDWSHDLIHVNGKRTPESRLFMQAIGEAGRLLTPDFWIRRLAVKIYNVAFSLTCPKPRYRFVISDLRYLNEAEWGKSVGGKLWKVVRTGDFEGIEAGANHISETALSTFEGWDLVIDNDSDLTSLGVKISDPFVIS